MTKLRIADRALEAYIAVGYPSGLDFTKTKQKSLERFNHWLEEKTKLGAAATQAYEAILALKDPDASVAAAARLGQLSQALATSLRTAELPVDVRTGEFAKDKTAAFCDQMAVVAEPLAARALEAFGTCLVKSSDSRRR